ncbi:hypothetical protein DH09_09775 [Bacillaceae bacterium JMAK1]|nr:hypothetical protein DH09_09775 [Bacillaceae bacterium JMAK1]
MLKMYTTQLQRVFTKIQEQEEQIDECGRLLAQALVGEGSIYVVGGTRYEALAKALVHNQDTVSRVASLNLHKESSKLNSVDRLIVITDGEETTEEIEQLQKALSSETPLVFIGPTAPSLNDVNGMEPPFHITIESRGLIPNLDGSRSGYPEELAIVYTYQALMFQIQELLA